MTYLVPVGMGESDGLSRISRVGDTMKMPPVIGMGNKPSVTVTAAAGIGATVTVDGTNVSGVITLNTGTLALGFATLGLGKVLTLTFADGFSFPSGSACVFSAVNANFANVLTRIYTSSGITTGAELNVSIALAVSTTYIGSYTITGW